VSIDNHQPEQFLKEVTIDNFDESSVSFDTLNNEADTQN